MIDAGDLRNAPAGHVHNYLGREGMPPAELLAIGRSEVAQYGVQVEVGTVTKAAATDDGFTVHLQDGRQVDARRLLVTTGRQWTADLTLFLHIAPAPTADEREQLDARGVTVVEGLVASWQAGGSGWCPGR